MENRMSEVAKLLGVELDEPFNIVGRIENPFTLTTTGLINCHDYASPLTLVILLLGKCEIAIQLLTQEEKEYLENVIRPYKEDVEEIVMMCSYDDGRFLRISIKRGAIQEKIDLPYILEGNLQFKGLENGNCYTPEELKLFEGEENNGK